MINKRYAIAAALALSFGVNAMASEVVLDNLVVRDYLYPADFKGELSNNLNFFRDGVGVDAEAKVPYDTVSIVGGNTVKPHFYVNTTEIGLYLNILVEVELAGNADALIRIHEVLDVLEETPTWKGLYFWPYDIVDNKLQPTKEGIVPAVDNANLALALAGVAGAYLDSEDPQKQAVVTKIDALLERQKEGWIAIYDDNRGLLRAGWSTKDNAALGYFIDRKANESRLAPLWASLITQGDSNAIPTKAFDNMELSTGSYTINGKTYNPMLTWDGTYFQGMMPSIWLNEKSLMPDYGMIEDMTYLQMVYAAQHNIPMVSSSATVNDEYAAFGVPHLSESKVIFNNQIHEGTTGTPHAVALSYIVNPNTAVQALKGLKSYYPEIESEFGWYDAVDSTGKMSTKILSLDQGMFVGAFFAEEINKHVERYLEARGFMDEVQDMYQSFVPNNR